MKYLLLALTLCLALASTRAHANEKVDPAFLQMYERNYQTTTQVAKIGLIGGGVGCGLQLGLLAVPRNPNTGLQPAPVPTVSQLGGVVCTAGSAVSAGAGLRGAALLENLGRPNVRRGAGWNTWILWTSAAGASLVGTTLVVAGALSLGLEALEDPDPQQLASNPLIIAGGVMIALRFPLLIASYATGASQQAKNRQAYEVNRRSIEPSDSGAAPGQRFRRAPRLLGMAPSVGRRQVAMTLVGSF